MGNTFIGRLWRGEFTLHETFWRYTVAYGLLINAITSVGFLILIVNGHTILAFLVGYGLAIPYNLFALIALWRSADRFEGERTTAEIMRIAGTVWILLLSIT